MNTIDSLRRVLEYAIDYLDIVPDSASTDADIIAVSQMLAAYDALAPDWTQAPDGATHYVIHANGKAEWLNVVDSAAITIVPKNAAWSYKFVFWTQFVDYVDLPPGVDWKECCWPQPK